MARNLRYIGSFRDVSYGVDMDGELFESIAQAKRALLDRYTANGGRQLDRLNTDGTVERSLYPAVTPEAHILLWPLPEEDRVAAVDLPTQGINGPALMEDRAAVVVWIGRRHAVRHGSRDEHDEVERIRKGAEVREAGSIVVAS